MTTCSVGGRPQHAAAVQLAPLARLVQSLPPRGSADLQAIIDGGQGDKPLKDLKFRCAKCGSRMTDSAVASEVPGMQPAPNGCPVGGEEP